MLQSGSRRPPLPKLRRAIALKLISEYGVTLAEAAIRLGISTSGVAQIIRRSGGDWVCTICKQRPQRYQRYDQLSEYHRNWVAEVLKNSPNQRDAKWTESIAVGDNEFVMETKAKLGAKAMGRRVLEHNEGYELRRSQPVESQLESKPKVLTTMFLPLKSGP